MCLVLRLFAFDTFCLTNDVMVACVNTKTIEFITMGLELRLCLHLMYRNFNFGSAKSNFFHDFVGRDAIAQLFSVELRKALADLNARALRNVFFWAYASSNDKWK